MPGLFRHPPFPQQPPDLLFVPPVAIKPGGIASRFAAGTPNIKGGGQRVFPGGIASRFKPGFLTVTGGGGGMVLMIGGTSYPILRFGAADPLPGGAGGATAPTIQSQTLGRWTAKFDVFSENNAFVPSIGQTVVLMENGTRLFMGCINDVACEKLTSTAYLVFHVTALDKSAILDHRILNVTYAKGTDVADAVRDIITVKMAGEGITLTTLAAAITTLDQDEQFYFVTARAALDKLATDCACVWWVDIFGDAHFVPVVSLTACPFSITETSNNARGLVVRTTLQDYRNKQYAISNLQVLPAAAGTAGKASIEVTETYTLPVAAATAAGLLFGTIITNQPIAQITSFKVNGVAQSVYFGTDIWNFRQVWWFFPGSVYVIPPNVQNNVPAFPTPSPTSSDPIAGDVVEIRYTIATPSGTPAGLAPPAAGIATAAALAASGGTCGTGVYEAVEQVKNVNLAVNLQAIATDVLARSGGVPKYFSCETDLPGAQVGQLISVNLPTMGATPADSFMITSVSGSSQGWDLGHGSSFRWQIVAQSGQDKGNDIKWFERLVARGENPLPIYQYEEATFVLAPGASLSSGVNITNPYIVGRAGKLVEALAVAGTAPVGQDLLIDILDNGVSIFAAGQKLRIPAGSTTLNSSTGFASGALTTFVFTKDVLTLTASYSVLSGSVTAASNVTIKLRWAI